MRKAPLSLPSHREPRAMKFSTLALIPLAIFLHINLDNTRVVGCKPPGYPPTPLWFKSRYFKTVVRFQNEKNGLKLKPPLAFNTDSKFALPIFYATATKPDGRSGQTCRRWNVAHHRDRGCREEGLQHIEKAGKGAYVVTFNYYISSS